MSGKKRTLRTKTTASMPIRAARSRKEIANRPTAKEKKVALAMHVESIMVKAAAHDRALEYFNKRHKHDTSMSADERADLVLIVSYLTERSNEMQTTIELVEKRERSRAESAVKQYRRPRALEDMSREEIEKELAMLRNGARSNY